ncbi:type IV toxin-antitoxin system AbiEi family antitoxin domain-containing protein [Kribbella sp. NPDC050281]|uniref:type IV toxin-antitoxin system AbiEi family antitoxin domain-containing protein n=1 Tax=Kribbella sp. NPDC050281 TaxID=3155515 RepID=UPI003405866A
MAEGVGRVDAFVELRRRQRGTFSRAQALAHGITDKVLGRRCRALQIQRVHPGVYVDFTGPLPWGTRVWAAWLAYGPEAALAGQTALRQYGVEGRWIDDTIHLALPHSRRVDGRPGVVVSRHRDLPAQLQGSREPPMVRLEVALLTTASTAADVSRKAAILLDACRQRRTTPARLIGELDVLPKLPTRRVLRQILLDGVEGVQSFLEQVYLRRVERLHRLPRGTRQARVESTGGGQVFYRDVEYTPYDLIVELDGRAGHSDSLSQWRDMGRDNLAALSGKVTLRFGYQLVAHPCEAAAQVAAALRLRGWSRSPRPCSPTCPTLPLAG